MHFHTHAPRWAALSVSKQPCMGEGGEGSCANLESTEEKKGVTRSVILANESNSDPSEWVSYGASTQKLSLWWSTFSQLIGFRISMETHTHCVCVCVCVHVRDCISRDIELITQGIITWMWVIYFIGWSSNDLSTSIHPSLLPNCVPNASSHLLVLPADLWLNKGLYPLQLQANIIRTRKI